MSGFVLPSPLPTGASSWAVVDYRRETLTSGAATAEVGGDTVTAYGSQLEQDEMWLVDRAVASCAPADDDTALRIYEGAVSPGRLLSGTRAGGFDEAEYPTGLLVQSGTQLLAVWSGVPAGGVGTLNLQVRVLRPVQG